MSTIRISPKYMLFHPFFYFQNISLCTKNPQNMDVNTTYQSTTYEQTMDILLALNKEEKTISAVKNTPNNSVREQRFT